MLLAAVGAAYLTLSQLAIWLNDPMHLSAGFWPAAGVTSAALLLLPTRRWAWVIAAIVVAEHGGNLAQGYPWMASVWWTVGSCLVPLVGGGLVRRFGHPAGVLVPLRNMGRFLAYGVVVGPVVGASVRTLGTVAWTEHLLWEVWPTYVVGDALGVLVIAPVLLTLGAGHPRRHRVETAVLTMALVVVPLAVFRNWGQLWDLSLPYLVISLLTWAALRFGVRGAAWSVFWVTQVASWATATGYGPFAFAGASEAQAVTLMQLYLAITATTALILAALVNDLSDRDEVEQRLKHQAHRDALTGLPTRLCLIECLPAALERSRSSGADLALLVCDLDHFKVVNDGLGHHVGDRILVEVARRLQAEVRLDDMVARLSGDEFVIVVEGVEAPAVTRLAERLLSTVAVPIVLEAGQEVHSRMSIGIATATAEHEPEVLLSEADAAMYRAKEGGRARAAHFDDALRTQVLERLALQHDLLPGLSRRELSCLHQPQIDLRSGKLFALESLVRWQHPERHLLTPDRFVPVAEATGAAGPLFRYVLADTLQAQAQWAKRLGFRPPAAVNLSPRQLDDPSLADTVAQALIRADVPAGLLWLEVTENAVADLSSFATLTALHDLGVRLAIDDFGTGWSSMARLSHFPWDLLKIDGSFVAGLGHGEQAEHVVRAIIAMARALGIRTVAEGVETRTQLRLLTAMGCDVAQGFLFSRPRPARDAVRDVAADGAWLGPPAFARRALAEVTEPRL